MSSAVANTGISKNNELNLNRLVNLALSSSPHVGIVNFNILKTFLIELLKALNLQYYEPKFGDDVDTKSLVQDAIKYEGQHDKLLNLVNNHNTEINEGNSKNNNNQQNLSAQSGISILTSDMKPLTLERFKVLEDKLARFEQQMSALNSLPSNQQIIDKSKDLKKTSNSGPILEIWQYTQLSKRLESNEEGITKLTSLLQDLINDINELKESQHKNDSDIKKLNDQYKDLINRLNNFDKLLKSLPSVDQLKGLESELEELKNKLNNMDKFNHQLEHLTNQIKIIETKIYEMVTHPDLELYVTWPALESSLKGLRDALDLAFKKDSVQLEQHETQTDSNEKEKNKDTDKENQKERQKSPIHTSQEPVNQYETVTVNDQNYIKTKKTVETQSNISRPASTHPSKELQDILFKLGTLNERHENLRELVEQLKNELSKKQTPNNNNQTSFKLPDDFADRLDEIKRLKSLLEDLKKSFNSETNRRMELENMISNLNSSLDDIRNSLKECLKSTQLNRDDIINLKEAIRLLDETKADKDWIKSEMERKADKRDLDHKVNKKHFEESINDISNSVNDCKSKTTNLEDEYRKANDNMLKELENKLDRLELDGLKEYIEKQLKKLKKLQKENIQPLPGIPAINPEDEAAGLRKPLLRFHCISCDRPIEMHGGQNPLPSLPAERGMRPIQTPRPYTTYELDQIRQFQKQQFLQEQGYDLFATVRQCGGSHTLTVPHKKLLKVPNSAVEETGQTQALPTHRNEVQLQGQDGHIYKGRIDARLPVEMKKPIKNSNNVIANSKLSSNHPMNSSYPNLRSVSESKENQDQDDQNFTKLPVFTN